jgi:hypothetical protein
MIYMIQLISSVVEFPAMFNAQPSSRRHAPPSPSHARVRDKVTGLNTITKIPPEIPAT